MDMTMDNMINAFKAWTIQDNTGYEPSYGGYQTVRVYGIQAAH